jgi:hypothetical protein
MKFLWSVFVSGLDGLLSWLAFKAAKTPSATDDWAVALIEKVADKFIPGKATADGTAWEELPALLTGDKANVVRSVTAIMLKEMLLSIEFREMAKLDDMQADRVLIAALTFLKPESVNEPEEIQAILDAIKPEDVEG